ncbi:MAG TPA: type II 3-dehydroquinate dehydratase [Bacillota bacterium]|jgi:3-dehydroquinate dehydratase-2
MNESPRILVLHGPNLGILGRREPAIYGHTTLAQLDKMIADRAAALGLTCDCRQHDGEGELIRAINHADDEGYTGIVINPAAYTHYSIALADSISACPLPVIEVHLSNIFARESFRRRSVTAAGARAIIAGLGPISYELAVEALSRLLKRGED